MSTEQTLQIRSTNLDETLAIAEAMAAGVPAVSTPTGIAPGLATTIPADSTPGEWANAIVNAQVIAPSEFMLEQFSVEKMVDSWSRVITNITSNT